MREVLVSNECEEYIEKCSVRVQKKFDYLLAVISEQEVVAKSFVDKIINSDFYELRIKTENQIRIIIFSIDNQNFNESNKVILLNAFVKKSNKDYIKAIKQAQKLLSKYQNTIL